MSPEPFTDLEALLIVVASLGAFCLGLAFLEVAGAAIARLITRKEPRP